MTLVMVGVSLAALFGLAALAVDMGMVYTARTHAQNAADAAALAGAYTFLNDTNPQPATAQQAAIAAAGANKVLGQPVAINAGNVNVDVANRRIVVDVDRIDADAVKTNFAAVVGVNSVAVHVRATAQCAASAAGAGSRCVKPIYVPNTALSTRPTATACTSGETIFDPATKALTAYARNYFTTSLVNTPRLLRPTQARQAVAPGQFYSLDFGSGGQDYKCTIGHCVNECGSADPIRCGQQFPLKTGNMVGPTQMGFNDLIGSPPADAWVSSGHYQEISTGIVKDSSRALVAVPVWDNCAQPITSGTAGQQLEVIGFVEMFVDSVVQSGSNKGDTTAHFVWATSCAVDPFGGGGGGPGGGGNGGTSNVPTGPFARPIQLIQNPQQ